MMNRLVDDADPALASLTELVRGAEPHKPNPFAKRLIQSRLTRALEHGPRRFTRKPVWVLAAGVLLAGSAAAASYSLWQPPAAPPAQPASVAAPVQARPAPLAVPAPAVVPSAAPPVASTPDTSSERRVDKPRAGEDPAQVAEAVRALRKQGDPARAQSLLDRYLRENPRGALAEDALALSIEAATARKDPRAATYARRYLARFPNGRFRGMAERALER